MVAPGKPWQRQSGKGQGTNLSPRCNQAGWAELVPAMVKQVLQTQTQLSGCLVRPYNTCSLLLPSPPPQVLEQIPFSCPYPFPGCKEKTPNIYASAYTPAHCFRVSAVGRDCSNQAWISTLSPWLSSVVMGQAERRFQTVLLFNPECKVRVTTAWSELLSLLKGEQLG